MSNELTMQQDAGAKVLEEVASYKLMQLPMAITTNEEYEAIAQALVENAKVQKKVTDYFSKPKAEAYSNWQGFVTMEKETLRPFVEFKASADKLGTSWLLKLKRDKEEAERKALEEAAAAKEKARLEVQAKEDKALEEIDNGNEAAAQTLLNEADEIKATGPAVVIPAYVPPPPKVAGTKIVTEYIVEIEDEAAVPVSLDVLGTRVCIRPVDLAAIKALAKANKGNIKIPGIRCTTIQKTGVTGR